MNLKNQMMKKVFNLLAVILGVSFIFAQNYQGSISSIKEGGMHQIVLSPEVISATRNNLDFIRILDSKNNEVPYIIHNGGLVKSDFKPFTILSRSAVSHVATSVIISNENATNLDHMTLKIANTEVNKVYSISGSNDQKEWFGLIDKQIISDLNEAGKTFTYKDFSFPLNNYKFLKFDFIDKNSLPINILEAGLQHNSSEADQKTELQNFEQKITTDKNTKQTVITITFPTPQLVDGIGFAIISPAFYQRDARILINKSRVYKRKREEYKEELASFQIKSNTSNQFSFSGLFTKELVIEIYNQDNPSLEIKKISLFQTSQKILADLKANENYTLKIDPKLTAPQYDLVNSGIDFNKAYPDARVTNLKTLDHSKQAESAKAFWQTSTFVWVCIILAVIIIAFFAVGLIKDMDKKAE